MAGAFVVQETQQRWGLIMIEHIKRYGMIVLAAALVSGLATTGCSVFISTPRVARFHVQRPDNKFIEYYVNLDDPSETNLDIHLTNRYTVQLDFEWLWDSDEPSELYLETNADPADPLLVPWMLCKYRF